MENYNIYLSTGKDRFTEVEDQPREYAGFVEANSLEMAFARSQNGPWPWNWDSPCRSSSVGDVIEHNNNFYMICGLGFKLIEEPIEIN